MKDVMNQIASLFASNHVDAKRMQFTDGCSRIITDALEISGPGKGLGRVTGITFVIDHNHSILNLRQESIEEVGIVEGEEGRPRLFVALKSGHYFEFSLAKEGEDERAE